MPRAPHLCLMIVAAFPLQLFAAAPAVVMAPVSASTVEVARSLGMEPERDHGRFLFDLVRLLHGGPENRTLPLEALVRAESSRNPAAGDEAFRVPIPLDPDVWSTAVFKRRVPAERLVATILLDRRASLLAAGLATLDDQTLEYLLGRPALVTQLYERGAAIVAAFGASLRIHDGRVVTPGGADAAPSWEAVVGAPVTDPERFVALLYGEFGGRVAYVYDTLASVSPGSAAFVLGGGADQASRTARLRALVAVAVREYREWKPEALPFSRAMNDLALLLIRLRVDEHGALLPPAGRAFWADVWESSSGSAAGSGAASPAAARPADSVDGLADAAWLAEAASVGNMYERGDRLDQIAFAQRVFGATALSESADAIATLRALPRQKMLMLTLERMGFRSPALFATVSRQASKLEGSEGNRGFWMMAQLQPATALLARMTASGTLDARRAERLVRSLFSVPLDDRGRYSGAIARWLERELEPGLPQATDVESRLILALAGPLHSDTAPRVDWEGSVYRVDVPYAEQQRLRTIRDKQGGYTVDLALDIERFAVRLNQTGLGDDDLLPLQRDLAELAATHAAALQSQPPDVTPPGVSAYRRAHDVIERVTTELAQAVRTHDPRRAARQAAPLFELTDVTLGEALLSLTYAADIGDPSGAALLTRNVALRHDFGYGRNDGESRDRTMWSVPRQDFQPGVPWHVTGSALGLDIALARLSLTRVNTDRLAAAPRLPSNERDGFAVGLALLDARVLDDRSRDAIADALRRGGARLQALASGQETLAAAADALQLEPLRRRGIEIALREEPARVAEQFTLVEQLALGGLTEGPELDHWGASAIQAFGCPCTQFLTPAAWKLLGGRPQMALAAASVPDLNLRVAAMLAELQLPAALAKPVLASAVQDFIEDAAPIDGADWWALSRAARAVSRERIEDYVAAAASINGVLVPVDEDDSDNNRVP